MKASLRLIRRKIRLHIPQLLGLILLLTVGVCFFVTLYSIVLRYEETAEQYFTDYSYADVTFYGEFNNDSVERASAIDGVVSAEGRTVRDFRSDDTVFRAVSLTDGINLPHLYSGRILENEKECILLKRSADAMKLTVDDAIAVDGKTLTITGLIASPEYIYMAQNERTVMANPQRFAVIYVDKGFFSASENYNEIVVLTDGSEILFNEASRAVTRENQISYLMYRSDLDEIGTFAFIFPLVFAVLIAIVIYVTLSRTIKKDRRQIGTMKALGVSDGRIIRIYLSQSCFAAVAGALLGCVAAVFITDIIIDIFSSMFEVPTLSFEFYPHLWLAAVGIAVLLCVLSGIIALASILSLLPAEAMRPRAPRGGKRVIIERIGFLWKRFTFNTRYALKNTLRNKGRFMAVVLGMCGSCALLTFSLGFYDSIGNTQDKHYAEFVNYDVTVSFDPIPLELQHSAGEYMDENKKALVVPVNIKGENYTLAITESDFNMVNIPTEKLQNGVILPAFFADEWGLRAGDNIEIDGISAVVSATVPQHFGLMLYTSYEYLSTVTDEIPPAYNTLYGRTHDWSALTEYCKENSIDFTTTDDEKTTFDSVMQSMSILVWFMIGCSVVLGFTVLYSVGLINLSAREYEYMFMGVMGYRHKSILLAHIKETALQLVLAIPIGFVLGNVIINAIKGEFSGTGFVIATGVLPQSYVIALFSVIGVTAVMALVTSRHISRLDIVEGLKARDE